MRGDNQFADWRIALKLIQKATDCVLVETVGCTIQFSFHQKGGLSTSENPRYDAGEQLLAATAEIGERQKCRSISRSGLMIF